MGVSAFGELRTLDAMHHDDLLSSLRADAAALLAAARSAHPDQVIEACPGWKPIDLVWHIGEVHFFWGTMVRRRFTDPEQVDSLRPERPADDEGVFDFAEGSAEMLIEALSSVDPSTEVWTWSEQKDVAFVIRRMAQETAVHRVDAERAAGNPYRVDAELASDGIDEFLEFFFRLWTADGALPLDGSVHLHCTDVDGEWVVTTDADGACAITREHAKGDAAMRGDAHDLLMVLWRRAPIETVDIIGDRSVAERLVARTNLE